MILILSINSREATKFAISHGLRHGSWHYIIGADTLRGLVRPTICRVGEYWKRRDIEAVEREVSLRDARCVSALDILNKQV